MAKTIPNNPMPYDTQSAATRVGCSIGTLRNYVRRGYVIPQRTPSGHLIFFDFQIEAAREVFQHSRRR